MMVEILTVDDVPVFVDIYNFPIGASFFVPSFNPERHAPKAKRVLAEHGMKTTYQVTVEDKVLGFRVWRVA